MKNIFLILILFISVLGCDETRTVYENDLCKDITCSNQGDCLVKDKIEAICVCNDNYHAVGLECVENTLECEIAEHEEAGVCVSNTKMVDCIDITPDNATSSNIKTEIIWENGVWSEADNCEWSCDEGYRKIEQACSNDTTPPIIKINGSSLIRIGKDDVYEDLGATVTDNSNEEISIDVTSNVDTSIIGHYTVSYNAVDNSGNRAITQTRSIHVVEYEDFLFIEDFEASTTMSNWVKSSGMNMPEPNFTYEAPGPSGGTSSIHITAHIDGLVNPNDSWYYYLKIPINSPVANDGGSLSFSTDIMVDEATAGHVKLGFNSPYYPIPRSGVGSLSSYISIANEWQTIQKNDVSNILFVKKENAIKELAYDGKADDIGISLNIIGILIYGNGPLDISIFLDNLSLVGTIMTPSVFEQEYTDAWNTYVTRVHDDIDERNLKFLNLPEMIDTNGITLCEKQQRLVDKLNSSYLEIQEDIETMYAVNGSSLVTPNYFNNSLMENVDHLLENYKSLHTRLSTSLDSRKDLYAYNIIAMKNYSFNGYDTPDYLEEVVSYDLRMTKGEYRSIATLVDPMCASGDGYTIENTSFVGDNASFSADNLDTYVAKIWYQAGNHNTLINRSEKFIVPELLLKDENLVRVNFETETNELKVTTNDTGIESYINISEQNSVFPDTNTITFNDATTLQSLNFSSQRYKLIWSIVHIPDDALPGSYTSIFKIKNSNGEVIKEFPINIEVLPFDLDKSKLEYSLYYPGKIVDDAMPVNSYQKSPTQFSLEFEDMKKHGVLYPNSYNKLTKLAQELDIRNQLGFPTDKFYTLGIGIFAKGVQSISDLTSDISSFQDILANKGYNSNELFIYAIDEATTENEIGYMEDVHAAGAKVFVAGYVSTFDMVGDYLDQIIMARGTVSDASAAQVEIWHNAGKLIFSYASPQVGVENPEVYRRNFGCKLWKQGFDGAMNWAYQAHRGAFWNDFDGTSNYREEAFTYPTTNGLVGTTEWEGFREAITDVRYISTLINLRDKLLNQGENVNNLNNFINNIDCDSDLDFLRESIINKILENYRD